MQKLLRTILFVFAVTVLSVGVIPVSAQIEPFDQCDELGISCEGSDEQALVNYIETIVNVFLAFVAIAAAVFLIIGGVQYITSRGDDRATETAKKTILYAVIGLLIVGLAAVVVNFTVRAICGKGGKCKTSNMYITRYISSTKEL